MKKNKPIKDEQLPSNPAFDVEAQLVELQMSVAHLELTVEQLNAVITKQDRHLRTLQRQLQLLYQQIESNQEDEGIAPFDVISDKPPHY
ncbi:SlyX family protein [Psychrobacter ciconiae]|uniref:SlyX family protein n=1 Tax=Psychrobacter ciconiae TaxID=1553449 RepID=UPI0019188ADC|nr:SlyX family protein [Psychrobacter ciconiae]